MMVSFVDQKELQNDSDVLSAHAQWETNYWHQHVSKVETNNRAELIGTRKDVKVTEIGVYNDKGAPMSCYLIRLAAKDGRFCPFSFRSQKGYRYDLEGAITEYTRAIEINPNLAQAYYNRGVAKTDQGDSSGA